MLFHPSISIHLDHIHFWIFSFPFLMTLRGYRLCLLIPYQQSRHHRRIQFVVDWDLCFLWDMDHHRGPPTEEIPLEDYPIQNSPHEQLEGAC